MGHGGCRPYQAGRYGEPKHLCRPEVEEGFVFDRGLHRKISRLGAAQDAVYVGCYLSIMVAKDDPEAKLDRLSRNLAFIERKTDLTGQVGF